MSSAGQMASPTFHSYFFPDDLSSLQPISGSLMLLQRPFCFAGYLAIGSQPILYALYCSAMRLEALKSHIKVVVYVLPVTPHGSVYEPNVEVPIFIKSDAPDASCLKLDLEALWSRPSDNGDLHHVYRWPSVDDGHRTIIIEAMFPSGHYPQAFPQFDPDTLAEMSKLLESYDKGSVVPESSVASSVVPESYKLSTTT